MHEIIIGLFGFDFQTYNKGCEALTYSFLSILNDCQKNKNINIKVVNFTYNENLGDIPSYFSEINFERFRIHFKNLASFKQLVSKIKSCDLFFDETFGDGFSDIYGKKWNVKTDLIKQIVLWSKVPLILLPQTYGPFKNIILRKWAERIISNATLVYSRDKLSTEFVKRIRKKPVTTTSDMAFLLPYNYEDISERNAKTKVGINISSLLWDGEWITKNSKEYKVNYQKYIRKLVETLIAKEYEVHLIPHVINKKQPDFPENDYRICLLLKNEYCDNVIIAPPFNSPIEAKSYIAQMDIFTGARMHSTIAAISSGVATIPYSYSRKFEGLFGSIDYPYIISAKSMNTESALLNTLDYVSSYKKLKQAGEISTKIAMQSLEPLRKDLNALLINAINKN